MVNSIDLHSVILRCRLQKGGLITRNILDENMRIRKDAKQTVTGRMSLERGMLKQFRAHECQGLTMRPSFARPVELSQNSTKT